MEEREENISKNIIEIMDREIKKCRQRERFFRGDHILQIQPSLTSVQEYEELLSHWDRKRLCKVVSCFVKDDPEAADDIVQQALERGFLNLKKGRPCSAPRRILKELKAIDDANQNLDLNQQKILINNPAAWIYVILRNTGQNYAGKREKEKAILCSLLESETSNIMSITNLYMKRDKHKK